MSISAGVVTASVMNTHYSDLFPGKNPTDEYLEAMMNEAPGPINFTMFLTMFGEKLNGTDPEDVIRNAFACFDEEGTGELCLYRLYVWFECPQILFYVTIIMMIIYIIVIINSIKDNLLLHSSNGNQQIDFFFFSLFDLNGGYKTFSVHHLICFAGFGFWYASCWSWFTTLEVK